MTSTYPHPPKIRATARCAIALGCSLVASLSSVDAITLDLSTGVSAGGIINDAVYFADNAGSGTGVFGKEDGGSVFLRIQKTGSEHGYNTSANNVMDNKSDAHTSDLLLSTLNQVTIGGEQYLAFLLDINESGTAEDITLENLKVFSSSNAGLSFQTIGALAADASTSLIYEMDDPLGIDHSVKIAGHSSGVSDMGLFIPLSSFNNSDEYIILYSSFSSAESGFEEWSRGAGSGPLDDPGPPADVIPEPSSGVLGLLGSCLLFLRRKK